MGARKSGFTLGNAILWLAGDDKELRKTLQASMTNTEKYLKAISNNVGGALMKFNIVFESLENGAKVVEGIYNSTVGALKEFASESVKKFAESGDSLDELSIKTGVSVKSLSELTYAARFSSIEMEGLQKSLKFAAKFMVEVSDGSASALSTLNELGLSQAAVSGMANLEERFIAVGVALAKMTNEEKRSTLATEIFGKAGLDMLPMFADGMDKITALREEARSLNIVYNDSMAKNASGLADAWDRASSALDGVKIQFGGMLSNVYRWAADAGTEILKSLSSALSKAAPSVNESASGLLESLSGLGEAFQPAMERMANWIGEVITRVQEWIKILTPDFKNAVTAFTEEVDKFFAKNKKGAEDEQAALKLSFETAMINTTGLAGKALESAERVNNALQLAYERQAVAMDEAEQKQALGMARMRAKYGTEAIDGVKQTTETNISILADFGKRLFEGIWDNVKPIAQGILDVLVDTFTIGMNTLTDIIATTDWEKSWKSMMDGLFDAIVKYGGPISDAIADLVTKGLAKAWNNYWDPVAGALNSSFYNPSGNPLSGYIPPDTWGGHTVNPGDFGYDSGDYGYGQSPSQTINNGEVHVTANVVVNGPTDAKAVEVAVKQAVHHAALELQRERRWMNSGASFA